MIDSDHRLRFQDNLFDHGYMTIDRENELENINHFRSIVPYN